MVTKDKLTKATWGFLVMVANIAKARLGPLPIRVQHSMWVERESPGTTVSRYHGRDVIDTLAIEMLYVELMQQDHPEHVYLQNLLIDAGIPDEETYGGYLIPLIRNWLKLSNPFSFEQSNISPVVEIFTKAVFEKEIITQVKNAIVGVTLKSGPIVLKEGVSIRPITEEELWGLGDEYLPTKPSLFFVMASEEWNILEVELKHKIGEDVSEVAMSLREAVIAGLSLLSRSNFGIEQIVHEVNYGIRVYGRWPIPLNVNRGGGAYTLDAMMAESLKSLWPNLRNITESKEHYLRMPVTRLIDGATRNRSEDAIIDYAIGLEALLTKGVRDELRYRFALRGATILNWDTGDKQSSFRSLQEFYDVRSAIVHGSPVDEKKLTIAQSTGEQVLRQIWWWFFEQKKTNLQQALLLVDKRILE